MIVRLIAYSKLGGETALKISHILTAQGHECRAYAPEKHCTGALIPLTGSAGQWAGEMFGEAGALIFCCACGIAVRAISPHVKSKTTDPAVLVVDECGKFAIPILSGHLGGANALAHQIADGLSAIPVVTTATDLHGLFAVDVFAKKNHLSISSMTLAKEISAALLEGTPVGFHSELPVRGILPKGLVQSAELGLSISKAQKPFPKTLQLIPKRYAVGLGCRRNTDPQAMEAFFLEELQKLDICPKEVRVLSSIDLKKDEACLLALSHTFGIPFVTHTAEALNAVPGEFSGSDFVKKTVGVDCVCERAAVLETKKPLIQHKIAQNGMTLAVSAWEEEITFE